MVQIFLNLQFSPTKKRYLAIKTKYRFFLLVELLYGSYPISVMLPYSLIGSSLMWVSVFLIVCAEFDDVSSFYMPSINIQPIHCHHICNGHAACQIAHSILLVL